MQHLINLEKMDTFSNTVQNTLTHKTFSTSKGRHLLPQVLSAMQSFWQLIYRPVNCCMISSERPPTHGSIQVVPRTVSLWFHHTRPVQVGQRRGLMVVAEAWRTAVPSHWCGSPASCCHCVSRLRLTRGESHCATEQIHVWITKNRNSYMDPPIYQ